MSHEQLKAFVAKVMQDTNLQDQVKAEKADLVGIANAAGFTITTDDLRIAYTEWVRDSLVNWNKKDQPHQDYSKCIDSRWNLHSMHYLNVGI